MNIRDMYSLEVSAFNILSVLSPWSDFSNYFIFLTVSNEGPTKTSSGSLSIVFPSYQDGVNKVYAELGGYDTQTMSKHVRVEAISENNLKEKLIIMFEEERKQILVPIEKYTLI